MHNTTLLLKPSGEFEFQDLPIPIPSQEGLLHIDIYCILKFPFAWKYVHWDFSILFVLFAEVLLRVHSVGICGSDVHFWKHGRIGNNIVNRPIIMGHELSATVMDVGEQVLHLHKGNRVAVEPGLPCRECQQCLSGHYNLCASMRFLGTIKYNGGLRQFIVHQAKFCHKLPDNVSFEAGALVEPLSVAVHSGRLANITLGGTILICGAGPIGLLHASVANWMGAKMIMVTDIVAHRLETAKRMGATHTLLLDPHHSSDASVMRMMEAFRESNAGTLPDVVVECTGAVASIHLAIRSCRSGGMVLLVGVGQSVNMEVPMPEIISRELTVKGVFRYRNCYPTAIDLLAKGAICCRDIISHRYNLAQAVEAFHTTQDSGKNPLKVIIQCDDTIA